MASLVKVARTTGLLKAVTGAPLARVGGVRQFSVTAAARGGMGTPVPPHEPPTSPLPEESELTWDGGDGNPESCLDNLPSHIMTNNGALALLGTGLGFFYGLYNFSKYYDKAATQPFAEKVFPFDNLKVELGRE